MNTEIFDISTTCNYESPAYDSLAGTSKSVQSSSNEFPELWGTFMSTEMWNQLKAWQVESETMATECRAASVSISSGDVSKRSSGKRKRDRSPDERESRAKVPRDNTYHSDSRPYYSRSRYHFSRIPEQYPSRNAKVYVNKNHPNFHKYFH